MFFTPVVITCIQLRARKQVVSIGVANKIKYLRRSWALPNHSKHNEASFSTISTDSLYLRVAQTPISPDLAIFVLTTIECFTSCACARGSYLWLCCVSSTFFPAGLRLTDHRVDHLFEAFIIDVVLSPLRRKMRREGLCESHLRRDSVLVSPSPSSWIT